MRVIAVLVLLLLGPALARATEVEDSAGRKVDVPAKVERIYAAGPPASVLVYALAPDTLTGWPRAPYPEEMPYIAAPYRNLPELGRLTGRDGTADLEVVLAARPGLIVDFGTLRPTYVSLADSVQQQTGIPYLLIDGRFEATPAALRVLGRALGRAERAERLARYAEETFAELDKMLAGIPPEKRPRVYLARGPDGLESGAVGSINTEILVADPEIIVTWDRNFFRSVWDDPLWARVTAVKTNRVYLCPTAPFGWIDRPPSLNRLIGLKWLARLFYPEHARFDAAAETRRFYHLFYHVDLSEPELERLLAWTRGKAP